MLNAGHVNIMEVVPSDSITVLSGRKERNTMSPLGGSSRRWSHLCEMDLLPKCCMCMHEQSRNGLCAEDSSTTI